MDYTIKAFRDRAALLFGGDFGLYLGRFNVHYCNKSYTMNLWVLWFHNTSEKVPGC